MKWVELCAGSAAVTLRLLGGEHAIPPVTYQGSKRKYAGGILEALGLRSGRGAESVILAEAGPWAEVWRYLSAGVALSPYMTAWNEQDDDEQAAFFVELREALPTMTGPARAAAWLWLHQRSYGGKGPAAGMAPRHIASTPGRKQGEWRHTIDAPAPRLDTLSALAWPSTTVHHGDVRDLEPFGDAVVYMDPPYQAATRYAYDLPRGAVIEVADAWRAAGSVVAVSEAEPLDLAGWHHLDITALRTMTPRNWSRQQGEWLTMSEPPATLAAVQFELFSPSV